MVILNAVKNLRPRPLQMLKKELVLKTKTYYTYIMSNASRTLYTGMTNNLRRRVREHKQKRADCFTRRYNITRLVWYACFRTPAGAIRMEKRIKGWLRAKKITLIESRNPDWQDLSPDWVSPSEPETSE